jgi:hypothetical protein
VGAFTRCGRGSFRRAGSLVFALRFHRTLSAIESILPAFGVARLLGIDELLSRIAVIPTRAPVATPTITACAIRRRPTLGGVKGFIRGIPQAPPSKPFHLGVRMFLAQALKCRQQFVALGSAKGGWKAAGKNRPVGISGWHVNPLPVA